MNLKYSKEELAKIFTGKTVGDVINTYWEEYSASIYGDEVEMEAIKHAFYTGAQLVATLTDIYYKK